MCGKMKKKQYSLKMCLTMKYQLIWHDKYIVCVTSNQPSIPCFKSHKTRGLPWTIACCYMSCCFFSIFTWLWMFLTEIELICIGLFDIVEPEVIFLLSWPPKLFSRAGIRTSSSSPSDLWELWELPCAKLRSPWAKLNLLWANLAFS